MRKNVQKKENFTYLLQQYFWKKKNSVWSVQRCSKANILKNRSRTDFLFLTQKSETKFDINFFGAKIETQNFDHEFFETKPDTFTHPRTSCLFPEFVTQLYITFYRLRLFGFQPYLHFHYCFKC